MTQWCDFTSIADRSETGSDAPFRSLRHRSAAQPSDAESEVQVNVLKVKTRIETALEHHLYGRDNPPKLGAAYRHALFPGGARARPVLALSVAAACGDDRPRVSDALAAAIECLHCASLVHDDLPCFDNAKMRRGHPSVHAAHGEALALLAGDGLIVLAFQCLSDVAAEASERLPGLLAEVTACAGSPNGLVSGQALETESDAMLSKYHAAKTGALFEAAAAGGAIAAGGDVRIWRPVGQGLGAAYQIADDIHDRSGDDGALGKPTGQDARLGRPNAVDAYGLEGAVRRLKETLAETAGRVPEGPTAGPMRSFIEKQAARFVPALSTAA